MSVPSPALGLPANPARPNSATAAAVSSHVGATGAVQLRLISARGIATALSGVIAALVLASATAAWIFHGLGQQRWFMGEALAFFNLNGENNLPATFSMLLLLGASLSLFVLARQPGERAAGRGRQWTVLGCVFAFLAADEAFMIHERVTILLAAIFGRPTGIFYYMWVIPYGLAVVLAAAYFLPFLWRLPRVTAGLIVAAGTVFVSGALGLELIQAMIDSTIRHHHPLTIALYHLEEAMEMGGVVLFIYALLRHLAVNDGPRSELRVRWQP